LLKAANQSDGHQSDVQTHFGTNWEICENWYCLTDDLVCIKCFCPVHYFRDGNLILNSILVVEMYNRFVLPMIMLETFFCWRSVSWRTDWIMEWMVHVLGDAALRIIISMFHWAHSFSPVFGGYLISQLLRKTCFEVLKILKMCITYYYTCQVLWRVVFVSFVVFTSNWVVVFVNSHPVGGWFCS
jgi:hypothetical protein